MTSTYIHTNRENGITQLVLRFLGGLYFLGLAAAIGYLWLFTQDRYVASSEFRISRQDSGGGLDSGLVQLALPGLSETGSADSQIAIGFIDSADLLLSIEEEFDLIEHYSAPKKDFVFRLDPQALLEERLDYYRERIRAHFDKETGMTVLKVDTFDPGLSHRVNESLLKRAEEFINEINQDVADQQLEFVLGEVERTGKKVIEVNRELIELQNKYRFINPDETIDAAMAAVQAMQLDRLRAETELATLQRDSPGSPLIEPLESRLRSLRELIDQETAKLSGPERDRLNQVLMEFRELEIKLEFANKLRSAAEMMLEKNRVEAVSQSRFFSVIQHPFVPEDVGVPRRPYTTGVILVLGVLLFFILRALAHSICDRN